MTVTYKKAWGTKTNIFGSSGAYKRPSSSGKTTITYSSNIFELISSGFTGTEIVVDVAFMASGANNVTVAIAGGLTTGQMDDYPKWSQQITKVSNTNKQISMTFHDLAYFKAGAAPVSSSDYTNSVWMYHRPFRYQSS